MSLTRNNHEERKALQEHLACEFEMKYLGELKYFLELKCQDKKQMYFYVTTKICLRIIEENQKFKPQVFLGIEVSKSKKYLYMLKNHFIKNLNQWG
jgi:hypothetical protein